MRWPAIGVLLLLTASCGGKNDEAARMAMRTFNVDESPPPPEFAPEDTDARQPKAEPESAGPQIAYTYSLGYRLGAERVAEV